MPRPHVKTVPVEAASPAMLAAMFGLRADDLARAIDAGLPVFQVGSRRRILIEDFKAYLRTRKVVSHG